MMIINEKTTSRDLVMNSAARYIDYKLQKIDSYPPGVLVFIIHFILSKWRNKEDFNLIIDIDNTGKKQLKDEFYDYYHLVVIILFDIRGACKFQYSNLADELRKIYKEKLKIQEYLYSTEIENKKVYADYKQKELEAMRNSLFAVRSNKKIDLGFSFLIPCFDHLEDDDLHETIYFYKNSKVKPSEDIELWIKRLFKYHKLNLDPSGTHKTTSHISDIAKELFHNTNDWAKTTYNNSKAYIPNFRGCYISLYLETRLKRELFGSIDYVDDYLKTILSADKNDLQISNKQQSEIFNQHKIAICELSVLDTGPGMARRWSEQDYDELSIEKENELAVKCFHKYITSDDTGKMSLRGQGLSKVLSLISKIGFIRILSGNVLLMRNFFKNPLTMEEIDQGNIDFEQQRVGLTEGTCITILYPILYSI